MVTSAWWMFEVSVFVSLSLSLSLSLGSEAGGGVLYLRRLGEGGTRGQEVGAG